MGVWLFRPHDVEQLNELSKQYPEIVKAQQERLDLRLASLRLSSYRAEEIELGPERVEKLRALGYLE